MAMETEGICYKEDVFWFSLHLLYYPIYFIKCIKKNKNKEGQIDYKANIFICKEKVKWNSQMID